MSHATDRADIELAFIRILSVGGLVLSGDGISKSDCRERIRCAILERGLDRTMFDSFLTFEEAYRRCYGAPLELRRRPRQVAAQARPQESDEDDDEPPDE